MLAPPGTRWAPVVPSVVCPVVPVTVPQLDVPFALHVALAASVTPGGSASATVTSMASEVPVFCTVIE